MSRTQVCAVLIAVIAAGCARNPQVVDEVAAAPSAAVSSSASSNAGTVVPDVVIDAADLVANTAPRPICRELLRPNSNVRTKRCMSAESWAIYDRAEAQRAGELLRTWQGGAYR